MAKLNHIKGSRMMRNPDTYLLAVSVVLSGLSLVMYNSGRLSLAYVFSAIYVLMAVLQPRSKTLFYIMFGLSNSAVLGVGGISASVLICAVCVVRFIFIESETRINAGILLVSFAYIVFSLNYYIRFQDVSYGLVFPIKNVFVLFYFYYFFSNKRTNSENVNILKKSTIYCIVGIISSLLVSTLLTNSLGRFRVLHNDSNMLSIETVTMLSIIFVLYFRHELFSIYELSIYSVLLGTIIILTGSRNGILLLAICVFITIILNLKRMGKLSFLFILILIATAVVLFSDAGKSALQMLEYRSRTYQITGDISNGRYEIWRDYLSVFNSNRINWLIGFGNYSNAGLKEMAHNGFLEDVTCSGLLGCLLLLFIYVKISKIIISHAERQKKSNIYSMLPVALLFLGSITLRGITNIINTTILFVGLMVITIDNNWEATTHE